MIYDLSYLTKKKIHTGVALPIVLLIIFLLGKLLTFSSSPSRASKIALSRLEVVNISSTQAVIVWMTPQKSTGSVLYGEDKKTLTRVVFDDRDMQDKKSLYNIHYAVLRNLKENTEYFFSLLADNALITGSNGEPYHFKTAKTASSGINTQPAYGKIIKANGLPVEGALVLLSAKNAIPLAAITKSNGEWLIPLNTLIDTEFMKSKTLARNDNLTIEIISEESEQSFVTFNIANLNALQNPLVIGKNYSFLVQDDVLSAVDYNPISSDEIAVLYPMEGSLIPGQSPLIKGRALPESFVSIVFDAKTASSQKVKTDRDGIWKTESPVKFTPGTHSLTVTAKDRQGKEVLLKRTFTIIKSGEQVLGNATPEAEPTIELTTPTPTADPTPQPTSAIMNTPTPAPPVSGANTNILIIGSFSAIILGIGIMLAF